MGFYDLSKENRVVLAAKIESEIFKDFSNDSLKYTLNYFTDEDTYIRKAAYLAVGKIHKNKTVAVDVIVSLLNKLFTSEKEKVRQTAINAAGELGKQDFEAVTHFFDKGLFDEHHSVRNAVIGSIKKMIEKNPIPVLAWAKKYLNHKNKEVRREICHGIELRGRTHPQDILPLLKELQNDQTNRVRETLIHVLGQIAYKKGCLETVIAELNTWNNKGLVEKAIDEIVDVHHRYRSFAVLSQKEAITYIAKNYKANAVK